ncbi:hypothetical protein L1987_48321 [Smallanthus sonchifolius]|uniref:Uncharacterized protein n=1 Tax=Smallanthus sonchifolius TaxID=185202 RepID=A0ACB9FSA2_9ASTR|nr:hypothetical protein L1987_48321 [Smallanthus sonchifolius]
MQKLKEAKRITRGKDSSSTILPVEAGLALFCMLARALEFNWTELSHEIGLWKPVNVINNEHDDKPEGEDDFDDSILAGRRLPSECNAELHTDYGGQAAEEPKVNFKDKYSESYRRNRPNAPLVVPWVSDLSFISEADVDSAVVATVAEAAGYSSKVSAPPRKKQLSGATRIRQQKVSYWKLLPRHTDSSRNS